jgi:hypothetical protein
MSTQEKFQKDLIQGLKDEKKVATILKSKYGCKIIDFNPDNDSKYDIKIQINGKQELIEVKTDEYEKHKGDTGNIFVEMYCSNKPSGILTSKSTIYCFFFPDKGFIYMIRTEKLRKLISDYGNQMGYTTGCGDGGRTKGVLIRREDWKEYFKVINL